MRYLPKSIEPKWQKRWLEEKTYQPDFLHAKKPFYNLMMFPYPSAEGLHVGNMYAFTGSDIYGRFKRMQGADVFEPIGLDGFGIHSENYALKVGTHPMDQADISEKNFYRQLETLGNGFAWEEKLETYDPEYYMWTQWIFTEMFRRGLAYRKKAAVNWCPSCKTVLADEQVEDGKCERCGTIVIKKDLEQWFFKITDYADRLLKNLETIDWSEKVKIAQKNWIGKSEGALIRFPLRNVPGQEDDKHFVEVFTTRPDTIFGVTFVAISAELAKFWIDIGWKASDEVKKYVADILASQARGEHSAFEGVKTGVDAGVKAVNPANKEEVPVWVVNYVLGGVGTGAIMGVPAHDERDFDFAKKFNLSVSDTPFVGQEEALEKTGGKKQTNFRLRDWLISRQRYWGPPIPMIFCDSCASEGKGEREDMPGWYAIPVGDLPVKLPRIEDFRPTGKDESPLASVEDFYKVKCPKCAGWARRETDVSDTFLDSAWYYLGYLLGTKNEKQKMQNNGAPWDQEIVKRWLPVDMYIGGAEHSVLHLLYVRFITMVFHDWGLLDFEEPFKKFRAHGLIVKDGAKMSKSKGNVINPDEYINAYGADALRMYLMFIGPFEQGGDFRDAGIKGITRFLERVWGCVIEEKTESKNEKLKRVIHKTIKKVTGDIEALQYNTAISALMILLNEFEEHKTDATIEDKKIFLQLLAPFAPHMTEDLWHMLNGEEGASIHVSQWPPYNPDLIKEDVFELVVQVNGKVRGHVVLPMGANEAEAKQAALGIEGIQQYMTGEPHKIIFVPNKLINFVV